jgi:hypothetical protein
VRVELGPVRLDELAERLRVAAGRGVEQLVGEGSGGNGHLF